MSALISNGIWARFEPSICSRCLRRSAKLQTLTVRRSFTTRPHPPLPSGVTILPQRALISISGRDAPKFLQGLTTNHVDEKTRTGWYSAFLNAQGRVLVEGFLYPTHKAGEEWSCLIEVEDSEKGRLLSHLKRHKLRSKVAFRALSPDELAVWTAWTDSPHEESKLETTEDSRLESSVIHLQDTRLDGFGHRFIVPGNGPGDQDTEKYPLLSAPSSDPDVYRVRRYLNGIPEGPAEIVPEHALPHESNLDLLNGVDFRKGCYVGQELTIRTQHTGVVRKRILPVQLYADDSPTPSDLEYHHSEGSPDGSQLDFGVDFKGAKAKRPAGKWLAGIGDVGLGLCRLENMTDMRVSAEGGLYKEGAEFWIGGQESNTNLKAKAFVPSWLRERAEYRRSTPGDREDAVGNGQP
jgi:folate-binding protein YgfZ